eukprot:c14747_g1_i1.p1 GENE.c14747_g1_i1~~c14747_g1_i1.p1  ORF type:complete len:215 (+),score=37.71 c14747_g1_i1:41-685(+)
MAWQDHHRIVFAVFRSRGYFDENFVRNLWKQLWAKFGPNMQASRLSTDPKSFDTVVTEINDVIRSYGLEIRKDKDRRSTPMQAWWFLVNTVDDFSAQNFGARSQFDAVTLLFLEKIVEKILSQGPQSSHELLRLSKEAVLGSEVTESHKKLTPEEAQKALHRFESLGFLEDTDDGVIVGRRTFQELRPLFTAREIEIADHVHPYLPFQWLVPKS